VSDVRGPASPAGLGIALRVRPDLVLLHVPPGLDPVALPGSSTPIEVVAADPQRELALVRVAPVIDIREEPGVDMFTGLDYVGVVEAMQAGPTIQPHFVGRVGRLVDERWPASVYVIDERMNLRPGALVFNVDGRLIGLVATASAGAILVPSRVIDDVANELVARTSPAP
jgi:hypothetical protein